MDWALMTAETSGANGLTINANSEFRGKTFRLFLLPVIFKYFKFANAQNEVTAEQVL